MSGVFKSIDKSDQSVRDFKAYKSWAYTNTASMHRDGVCVSVGIKPNTAKYPGGIFTDAYYIDDPANRFYNRYTSASCGATWYSINQILFNKKRNYHNNANLFSEVTVFSAPNNKVGERVQSGSFYLRMTGSNDFLSTNEKDLLAYNYEIVDDGNGFLIDQTLPSPISSEIFYLDVNDTVFQPNIYRSVNTASVTTNFFSNYNGDYAPSENLSFRSPYSIIVVDRNIVAENEPRDEFNFYRDGYIYMSSSYIKVQTDSNFNKSLSGDFSVSFTFDFNWNGVQGETTPPQNKIYTLATKRVNQIKTRLNPREGSVVTEKESAIPTRYPFHITWNEQNGQLICSSSSGDTTSACSVQYLVTGGGGGIFTTAYPTRHVVYQKSGSLFKLYVDTFLVATAQASDEYSYTNDSDILIGAATETLTNCAVGRFSQFTIFNKALSSDEIAQLCDNNNNLDPDGLLMEPLVPPDVPRLLTNTNIVGKVDYSKGLFAISGGTARYQHSTSYFGTKLTTIDDPSLVTLEFLDDNAVLRTINIYPYIEIADSFGTTQSYFSTLFGRGHILDRFFIENLQSLIAYNPLYSEYFTSYNILNGSHSQVIYLGENTPEGFDDSVFRIQWRSTQTIYEYEYLCRIPESEFNLSTNPTLRDKNDFDSDLVKDIVQNNAFKPYITTIGLYDKHGRLLAVAKLNSPIQKRDDVDLNILVRFDL